jgi:N-acetylmuramoyl-L-alanine amidase
MSAFPPDTKLPCEILPSPNHGERRGARAPDAILLHYTGMPTAEGAIARLCDPAAEVSCHYVVHEDGRILQLVPEARRAWHAGAGIWKTETDLNSASIGIEIINAGHDAPALPPYPAAQIDAVAALCLDILSRHPIAAERILAHSDVAPQRKRDPGEHFPWGRLAAMGVGHFVTPTQISGGRFLSPGERGAPVTALQTMLGLYGYGLEITGNYDAKTEAVVRAFQRHFRPARVDGVADASTITTLRDLLAALPASASDA